MIKVIVLLSLVSVAFFALVSAIQAIYFDVEYGTYWYNFRYYGIQTSLIIVLTELAMYGIYKITRAFFYDDL